MGSHRGTTLDATILRHRKVPCNSAGYVFAARTRTTFIQQSEEGGASDSLNTCDPPCFRVEGTGIASLTLALDLPAHYANQAR